MSKLSPNLLKRLAQKKQLDEETLYWVSKRLKIDLEEDLKKQHFILSFLRSKKNRTFPPLTLFRFFNLPKLLI